MTTIQMLTVRTNAALGRLAALQRRAEKVAGASPSVIRPALKELNDALEELKVANEQLQSQVEMIAIAEARAFDAEARLDEVVSWLPCACIWTNPAGEVIEANPAAATLLNVSSHHLVGRPLMLFVMDRVRFTDALSLLSIGEGSVFATVVIRPRERRARTVKLVGRRHSREDRLCWFLVEGFDPVLPVAAVDAGS